MRELGVMATGVAALGAAAEPATLNLPAESPPRRPWPSGNSSAGRTPSRSRRTSGAQANGTNAQAQAAAGTPPTVTDFVKESPVQQVKVSRLDRPAESTEISRLVWMKCSGRWCAFRTTSPTTGPCMRRRASRTWGSRRPTKRCVRASSRRWLTHVSAAVPATGRRQARSCPLFSFHGRNGSARFQAQISEWHDVARDEGFIVVYPHGLQATWTTSIDANNTDVQFFLDLLDEMKRTYQIDEGRAFLNGSSQGTALTNRIAVQYPQLFAASRPGYPGHLSAASYANPIVRSDIALPVQCWGEQELPTEFPGGTAWRDGRQNVLAGDGEPELLFPSIAIDGRRTTEIWNSGRARVPLADHLGHRPRLASRPSQKDVGRDARGATDGTRWVAATTLRRSAPPHRSRWPGSPRQAAHLLPWRSPMKSVLGRLNGPAALVAPRLPCGCGGGHPDGGSNTGVAAP